MWSFTCHSCVLRRSTSQSLSQTSSMHLFSTLEDQDWTLHLCSILKGHIKIIHLLILELCNYLLFRCCEYFYKSHRLGNLLYYLYLDYLISLIEIWETTQSHLIHVYILCLYSMKTKQLFPTSLLCIRGIVHFNSPHINSIVLSCNILKSKS